MRFFDRYTGSFVSEKELSDKIELGRYAVCDGSNFKELTSESYNVKNGQLICDEFLDDINKDIHDIFKGISDFVELGRFEAIPLIQPSKKKLEFGEFASELEKNFFHIENVFQNPYSKLNRSIEKVSISQAKRISNRSTQYLAAHTEDWLHKGLVKFCPGKILVEENISSFNVYENQLLVAFVIRASRYIARRNRYIRDTTIFQKEYKKIIDKEQNQKGWFQRVHREYSLAGKVYEDKNTINNKSKEESNKEFENLANSTEQKLKRLLSSLRSLRKYDLFEHVDKRVIKTIIYHDTNVLINDKHYKYLKKLWSLLLTEDNQNQQNDDLPYDLIISNVRNYGISLINYAIKNENYLNYKINGVDKNWKATKKHYPDISLYVDKYGIINVKVGLKLFRFIITCSLPPKTVILQENTYILAYEISTNYDLYKKNYSSIKNIIPLSLADITCVERVAIIFRREILKQYVENTLFKTYEFPRRLTSYFDIIGKCFKSITINKESASYTFIKYPDLNFKKDQLMKDLENSVVYKKKGTVERKEIEVTLKSFIDNYVLNSNNLIGELNCFNLKCHTPITKWNNENLSYIECQSCGFVLDLTNRDHVLFYKKDKVFSAEEMGMDYLDICLNSLQKLKMNSKI